MGPPGSGHFHGSASLAGHHRPDSRRVDRGPWWIPLWRVGWTLLFDDWADARISGGIRGWSMARRPLRSAPRKSRHLAQARLHRRSRGCDSLFRDLPDSWATEGHGVLPLRPQPHAILGLRGRFHARSYSWHMGTLGAGCSHGLGRLCRGDSAHGLGRGAGAAAVLLPQPPCRMVSWEPNSLGGWRSRPEVARITQPPDLSFFGGCVQYLYISFSLSPLSF